MDSVESQRSCAGVSQKKQRTNTNKSHVLGGNSENFLGAGNEN